MFCRFRSIANDSVKVPPKPLDIDALRAIQWQFRWKYATIPEVMLSSKTLAKNIIKWIKAQNRPTLPVETFNIGSIWGMKILAISDEDALRIPQLGLESVIVGSMTQILELLDKYNILLTDMKLCED